MFTLIALSYVRHENHIGWGFRSCTITVVAARFLRRCAVPVLLHRQLLLETFSFKDENGLRVRDLTQSFFAYSQNIDSPESFILPFFIRKVSTVIFSEGGYALSRSQKDKTSNIWYLVFATKPFALKLVVELRRLPPFPAKMTLVHARALLSIEKSRSRSRTRLRI